MKQFSSALLLALCLLLAATPLQAAIAPVAERLPAQQSNEEVLARIAAIKAATDPHHSTFNDAGDDWETDSDEDVQRSYGPGVYHLRVAIADTVAWGVSPASAQDFYAEVDTYHVDGPLDNEFGILFRNDGNNYYIFNISSDGYYRLHKWLNEEWVSVVDWAESTAIVTGENSHNRLGVLAEGPNISVLVNDVVLATVTDDSIDGDGLALAVGTFDEGGVEVAFDDFLLWQAADSPLVVATPETAPTPEIAVTPEPVEEPQSTLDPELVQTVIEPIRGNTPDYSDDFRRADDRWPTVEEENGAITFANRGLNLQIDQPNYALWTSNQEIAALNPGDVLVEADARRDAGAPNATYGLLVRFVDNNNFYYFGVSGAGTYSFWRVVAGEWTKLIDWTAADAVDTETGGTNRLGVLAQGDRFLLLANDVPLAETTDGTFAGGGVGVYGGVYDEAGLDVTFDNLDMWVLSEGQASLPVDTAALSAAQTRADEVRGGEVTYEARFSRDDGVWSVGEDDTARVAVEGGSLVIEVNQAQWLAWADNEAEVTDFQLEVDVALADPAIAGEVGLVFRMQDENNFYFLPVDNTGRFSLWKKEGSEWQALADWAKSELLDTTEGAENRIGVLAEGNQLTVLINEQAVATLEDASFDSGTLALAVGTFDTPGVSAAFDNLSLWNLAGD